MKKTIPQKTIECTCIECKHTFQKSIGEVNRKLKLNTPFYCSLSCSNKANYNHKTHKNRLLSHENKKHLRKICGNRRDKYTPFRMLLNRTKQRNTHQNNLTLDYIRQLWESQSSKCAILGHTLQLPSSNKKISHNDLASIDRIDSSKGYVEGNIRIVCATINYAKNKFDDTELYQFIKLCKNAVCC